MPSRTIRILGAIVLICVFLIVACEATFKTAQADVLDLAPASPTTMQA